MNKKAIILGVTGIFLLLTGAAVYYLIEVEQLSFIMAFMTVASVFWSTIAVVMLLLRDKLYDGLRKLSKERRERLLANYNRQYKLYKFILWQSPLYVVVIFLIYKYDPSIELNFINIAIIAVAFYLSAISSVFNKKYVINILKEN
jgi:uncharacterized membrane protein